MQTNNISCRNLENYNKASEAPNRLTKAQNSAKREQRVENAVENLMQQISESIAKKSCSREANCAAKTETSSELSDTSNQDATATSTDTTTTSTDDGMTQLINTKTPSSGLDKMLSADSSGNVNEEQLQSAIVQHLLEQKNPELGKSYLQELSNSIASGNQFEDSVKNALKVLVKQGLITKEEAEKINGDSFRAAQLDSNLQALYDSKGGKNDNTVAVMKLEEAIKSAMQILEDIKAGKTTAEIRSLDAPSNQKGSASSISGSSSSSGGGEGFLWKPVSDSNGKLVVLFPPNLTGEIVSAGIYSKEPASYENMIEEGKFSGDGNGGRSHFRFAKPGSAYPDGVIVVAQLKDGSQATFKIGDSSSRNT